MKRLHVCLIIDLYLLSVCTCRVLQYTKHVLVYLQSLQQRTFATIVHVVTWERLIVHATLLKLIVHVVKLLKLILHVVTLLKLILHVVTLLKLIVHVVTLLIDLLYMFSFNNIHNFHSQSVVLFSFCIFGYIRALLVTFIP